MEVNECSDLHEKATGQRPRGKEQGRRVHPTMDDGPLLFFEGLEDVQGR